jgi:cation-transporting ATPase 13A3/4/5
LEEVFLPNINNSHLKTYCKSNINKQKYKYFRFKLYTYIYNEEEKNFKSINFNVKTSHEKIHKIFTKGLTSEEIIYQRNIFGACDLVVKIDSVFNLFLKEATDPFYIFQICSIILWLWYNYEAYAFVISITTAVSLIYSVYETRENLVNIQQMARYTCKLNVFRQTEVNLK